MTKQQKNIAEAINTLKSEGFRVTEATAEMARLERNGNWIEVMRDESSYMAYTLGGNEWTLNMGPSFLQDAVEFAVGAY